MKPPFQFDDLAAVALPAGPVHLAIGMFDGVHRGHRAVIESAVQAARRGGGVAGVLTFEPHPSVVLRPDQPTKLLLSLDAKRAQLAGLGIDFLVEQRFTKEFAGTTAAGFVDLLKRCLPGLQAVYVGDNWRFGRGRAGDVSVLLTEAARAGFAVFSLPGVTHQGTPVNSTRIRELIAGGEIAAANALLGYSYFCDGVVERGKQLGRTIGFPTLNVRWEPALRPKFGIYAVWITGPDGRRQPGAASYGVRPTIEDDGHPLLEVYVLEPTKITYGDAVRVEWIEYLRPEAKFANLEELKAQIAKDCDAARRALKTD
ncbi:MAG TPA: riboflavin biosynthesis protein RibF [Candidatus Didemnitutus sp.]|nr:riboflavin biosynthesis protein RibF [Candidatus Didemnitutus sp.]